MTIAHFTLGTRDVPGSAHFFETIFGWRSLSRPGNVGRRGAWLEIAPGQELHLVEVEDFAPSPFEGEFGRHIALSFPQASFARLKEELVQHGIEPILPTRETPFERFFFRDPNGYIFEIVAAEREPEA
jgi:catechol 2,3-dioxygenase-like lactoylglutathione lyase family enzyme